MLFGKQFYPVAYEDERWYKWQHFRQRFGHPVQEYTTEFHNQAMVLDIDVDDYDIFMKYTMTRITAPPPETTFSAGSG